MMQQFMPPPPPQPQQQQQQQQQQGEQGHGMIQYNNLCFLLQTA